MPTRASWLSMWLLAAAVVTGLPGLARAGGPQVYCQYMYFGTQYSMCLPPPVAEAKKTCEAKAKKEHGEELSCFCSDDPTFVGEACEAPQAAP